MYYININNEHHINLLRYEFGKEAAAELTVRTTPQIDQNNYHLPILLSQCCCGCCREWRCAVLSNSAESYHATLLDLVNIVF